MTREEASKIADKVHKVYQSKPKTHKEFCDGFNMREKVVKELMK